MKRYDEYEVVETDHDEAQVLDIMYATQADEVERSYEAEQAYIKACTEKVNVIYASKAVVKRNQGGNTHD